MSPIIGIPIYLVLWFITSVILLVRFEIFNKTDDYHITGEKAYRVAIGMAWPVLLVYFLTNLTASIIVKIIKKD